MYEIVEYSYEQHRCQFDLKQMQVFKSENHSSLTMKNIVKLRSCKQKIKYFHSSSKEPFSMKTASWTGVS